MDINSMKCRLCLTTESNLLNIFDEKNLDKNIAAVLVQHFWFEVQEQDANTCICDVCWLKVDSFHTFYIQVQNIHNELETKVIDTIKVELEEEKWTEPAIVASEIEAIDKPDSEEDDNSCDSHFMDNDDDTVDKEPTVKKSKPTKKSQKKIKKEVDPADQLKIERENQQIEEYFPMDCELCTTRCTNFQNIQIHYRKEHKIRGFLRCCKRKFLERTTLLEHIQWHLNPETFKCETCNKAYSNKRGLIEHQGRHLPAEEKPFKCTKCPKSYNKRFLLEEHLAAHKNAKKFVCEDCEKSFDTKRRLKAHRTNIHTNANINICDVCAKEFRSKSVLEHHQKTVHQNIVQSKVQCQVCGKWLKHKYQLSQHMVRHEESKMNLSCNICGKRSLNRKALRSHIKIVHTDKLHNCTICEKTFKKQISLKEHMAIHTGDTLYTCSYCPKTFNSSANMYSHKKKVHVKEWEEHERLKASGAL